MTPLEEAIASYREQARVGADTFDTVEILIEAALELQTEFDTAMVLVRGTIEAYRDMNGQPELKAVSLTDYRAELRKVGREYLEKK